MRHVVYKECRYLFKALRRYEHSEHLLIADHFSGPGRSMINQSGVCVCMDVWMFGLLKRMTLDLDIWHSGSPWHYIGQVQKSRSKSTVTV